MEKEILKQVAVLMSEIPGKLRTNHTAESKVVSADSLSFIRVHRSVYYAQVKRPVNVQRINYEAE